MTSTLSEEWQLAGLGDAWGDVGGTMFPLTKPWVPVTIWIEGDNLRWRWGDEEDVQRKPQLIEPDGALAEFIGIGTDPARVLKFAMRYGVLGLCEHGMPTNHNPQTENEKGCDPAGNLLDGRYESLARWFSYARAARTMLNISAKLHRGRIPPGVEWEPVFEDALNLKRRASGAPDPVPSLVRLEFARMADAQAVKIEGEKRASRDNWLTMAMVLNEWLRMGAVRPWMTYTDAGVEMKMLIGTFGALAIQLAAGVSKTHGVAICSGCDQAYPRKAKLQRGRRNFCDHCGETTSARLRQRDYKRRVKEGKLHG